MQKQILINVSPLEVRVALLQDGVVSELHFQRARDKGLVGNIHKGRVLRVLPGMEAAFLDIGLEKAAFLHVSDLGTGQEDVSAGVAARTGEEPSTLELETTRQERVRRARRVPIDARVQKGQELLVQVSKEPIGGKGARVTTYLSFPGRHLVYMPTTHHIGVSRRIADADERARLREIVKELCPPEGGVIVRTACEGLSKREIQADLRFLTRLWAQVQKMSETASAATLLHTEMDLTLRTIRDAFTTDVQRVVVDSPREHQRILDSVETLMPRLKGRVELYEGTVPLFERYGVERGIERALNRRVWLKSGGYLVIQQSEALTSVDVNTGRYVGKRNQEETVTRINVEAAQAVVEQLRLRNLGGIIIVDFIDMETPANRKKVTDALGDALRRDKTRTTVSQVTDLGLVQLTRQRTRESLERLLCMPCPRCEGTGRVKSVETIAAHLLRRIQQEGARLADTERLVVSAHPSIANFLYDEASVALDAVERQLNKKIIIKAIPDYPQEHYDIVAS